MAETGDKEKAIIWRDDDLAGLEVLHASYVTHAFAQHTHETFAIGLIEAGAGAFTARRATHVARTSEVFIIHPDEAHNGYAAAQSGWTYRVLYPDPTLFQRFGPETRTSSSSLPFFPQTIIADIHLRDLLLTLHTELQQASERLTRETALLMALGYLLTTYAAAPLDLPSIRGEQRAVSWVKDYLHAHYADSISLDQLASLVQLHPSSLIRAFHARVGLPPHAYLNQLRISHARKLLREGMSIAQVALETGFADQSHLTRHFKQHVGVAPGRYAQSVRNVQDGPSKFKYAW